MVGMKGQWERSPYLLRPWSPGLLVYEHLSCPDYSIASVCLFGEEGVVRADQIDWCFMVEDFVFTVGTQDHSDRWRCISSFLTQLLTLFNSLGMIPVIDAKPTTWYSQTMRYQKLAELVVPLDRNHADR